jgi:hypothetical protein
VCCFVVGVVVWLGLLCLCSVYRECIRRVCGVYSWDLGLWIVFIVRLRCLYDGVVVGCSVLGQ